VDRMSPLDATFLHVEDGITHMHIASCARFEGPPPPYDEVVELFRRKLPLVPRYRQRVRFVPGDLGRPVWVDDPHFLLEYHVRHTALPPPGGDDDLRRLMGRLMSQPLDRSRPLWETWVVEGLADGTWALISKIHHCMADGVSGTDLMSVVLDDRRDPPPSPPVEPWAPGPEPSDAELVREALRDMVASPLAALGRVPELLGQPQRLVERTKDVLAGARSMSSVLRPNTALSIEGHIGPHRRWAWSAATLDEVKLVRESFGGTVNDVVLTAISGGFRELLVARGEPVDGVVVRSLVPVSVRAADDHSTNNQVASIIAELPVGIADPVERLRSVTAHMVALKESHQPDTGVVVLEAAEITPAPFVALGLRAGTLALRHVVQRNVNTVTTNVPGPRQALYACGREMLAYYPFVPLSQGVRTGVAILSYNGKIGFGVTGDWDSVPDVGVLADGIRHGMDALLTAARAEERLGA